MEEILINRCYGGFSIPDDVRDAIFDLHPPHTELGAQFFAKQDYVVYTQEQDDIDKDYILASDGYTDYRGGYRYVKGWIVNKRHGRVGQTMNSFVVDSNNTVWYIEPDDSNLWRTHIDVIRLCKEMRYIGKKIGYTKLGIAECPKGYKYSITDYDGREGLDIIPPMEAVLQDMLRIIKGETDFEKNPLTEKLVSGELSIGDFMHP